MKELNTDQVRELLDYDPETGIFTWRERGPHWFKTENACGTFNTRFVGRPAGSVSLKKNGYPRIIIGVDGSQYRASRLAFLWMGEELPEQVDHEDRNSLNNAWKNLRRSSHRENTKNKSMYSNNTSGYTGVSWNKTSGKWLAQVSDNGRLKNLGYFNCPHLAGRVVAEFRKTLGFSPSHGFDHAPYQEQRT